MASQPPPTHLFLFGDQTYDFVPDLRRLLAAKNNPILAAFLEQSHYVVRAQMIQKLPPQEHKAARTASLAEVLQKYVDGVLPSAFQTALSCITQLGSFMYRFGDSTVPYPHFTSSYVLGVCTGSLAAAAISCSSSLSALLPIAVQTVLVAFRLGLQAQEVRDRLEASAEDRKRPWSVVSDLQSQEVGIVLDRFNRENMLPPTRKPWITAISAKTTTISGSPLILEQLSKEPSMKGGKRWREIPIYVPAHNPCLFSSRDVDVILETTDENPWSEYSAKIPFLSAVTGKLVWVRTYRELLRLALTHCLVEPIRWDTVEMEVPRLLKTRTLIDAVTIVPFTTVLTRSLSGALEAEGIPTHIQSTSDDIIEPYSHRPGSSKRKLAIVSMSGRFPEAQSTDTFWDLLYKGLDVCKEVPSRRWDVKTHVDPSGKAHNKGATRWGCWLDFAGEFDARFFSISPKEAPQMDPAQRMALMSTYEAMERGGIVPDTTSSTQRNRIGVFHGVTSNDWMETNTAQNIDTYFITGGNRGFIPGRINFCFEFSGPSYSNDTACSSSLAAIHLACNSLWRGDCDTAVAGGTNMIFTPDGHTGLDKGFFLSRTGNCKPFDDAADGYCRAEGVGTVMIKRLEDALAEHDPILGTILDIKTNHSAMSDSMTRPFTPAQIDNMSAVLSTAGVSPLELSYIEMHGTGTQVGDAVEMESVLSLFAPNETFRPRDKPLYVGSAKANIGHGEGVSGVTSLIKVLLMMKHNTIPPHCGIKPGSKINRNYPDLPARNVHIALEPQAWPRTDAPRRVLINNFSAAGGNTAVLIEDAPIFKTTAEEDPRSKHIITISGHVGKSLKTNLERLRDLLTQRRDISPAQLSYTTTARRWHHLHRVSIRGSSTEEILHNVELAIQKGDGINRPKAKPNIVLACSGQGSQYSGMGRKLYETYPTFRTQLERFDQLAQSQGFPSFLAVYTAEPGGDSMDNELPVVVQLALVGLEMALGDLLTSFDLKPSAVVGHSLGEYAALYLAGVLSAADTLYLVGKRAELLQERCQRGTHAMLAVRAPHTAVKDTLADSNCEIACRNGPNDTVLSGSVDEIMGIQRALSTRGGVKGTLLKLPFAFHSAQVQPILAEFEDLARGVTFHKPRLPIMSPLLVQLIEESGVVSPSYLARHCREPVNMVQALELARDQGIITDRTVVIDVGPKALLAGMVKMTLGMDGSSALPILGPNLDVWPSLQAVLGKLYAGGLDINWAAYHAPFHAAQKVIDMPDYGWDLKEYFIPYKGEWCLHRHEIHCNCADVGKETATSDYKLPTEDAATVKRPSKMDETKEAYPEISSTTTVHRVVEETTEPLGATLVVETDISRKDVNDIAQGHLVDGIPLCTPSFYADIALQVGRYSMNRLRASHPGAMDGVVDVCDLVVDKALIPHGKSPQLLRTTLTMSWPPKAAATTRSAKIKFATYYADGKLDTEHATCTVRFTSDAQRKSLQLKVAEYQAHMERLRQGLRQGEFVRYTRKSGYKLMSSMAHFHPDYKLLDHLILNEEQNEAVSIMDFSAAKSEGTFAAHPAYVDAITQVAGFAMNANDNTDIERQVYVNHGWDSFQVYQPLVKGKSYQVYARMVKDPTGDLVHGDTIVLDGDVVVAFFKGLSLRCVPRRGLRMVLQQAAGKATSAASGAASKPSQRSVVPPHTTSPKPTPKPSTVIAAPVAVAEKPSSKPNDIGKEAQKVQDVLRVISEESGVALEELTDDSNFADMGIDSLSSMVIGSRLREDLALDFGTEFSLFIDCPTVATLKVFLIGSSGSDLEHDDEEQGTEVPVVIESYVPEKATPVQSAPLSMKLQAQVTGAIQPRSEVFSAALRIVSEESGVALEELTADTVFADIGIDSLSSMVITSRLREDLRLELDSTFNLFDQVPSVSRLQQFLGENSGSATPSSSSSDQDDSSINSGSSSEDDGVLTPPIEERSSDCRPTKSVILQGLPKMARKILFMLPDGGGSASSYLTIPRLQSDVAIVGLNCPYARDPENMNCTHQAMIASFCQEIKRRQPEGPYHLGGWSSGGAFAYVTAEALVNMGEEVHSLVIIDAPVPQVMEKLPTSFYEYCNNVGLFANQPGGTTDGTAQPPPYLIPHFQATVDVMLDYRVAALKTGRMPKVGLIWAAETVMEEQNAPKMKGMHFMVQKRTDFGPDGWDTVLPGAEFDIVRAEGANHFTLMQKENVYRVRELIDRVMG